MSYEEAIAWCIEYMADVSFIRVQSIPRVTVRVPGGFPFVERYTFLEAVQAAKDLEERTRAAAQEVEV